MMNVESYRQYAADCVRKAQGEETPEERNILLNVALAWLRLARQTETLDEVATDFTGTADESGVPAPATGDEHDEAEPQEEPRRLAS